MNIRNIIQKIRNRISPPLELPNEAVLGFLRVLETAESEEISCDELFIKLDEYVEREVDKKDAAKLMPVVRDHLDKCPECCDEYEALLDVLENTTEK
jgi:histidyl-tRNA synthetase